jgi:hypothetical protein
MQNVKLIRLNTNDDIIAKVIGEELGGGYIVSDPLLIEFYTKGRNTGIAMISWLSTQIMKHREVFIKSDNIMFITEPTDEFIEYYTNSLVKLYSPELAEKDESVLDEEALMDQVLH